MQERKRMSFDELNHLVVTELLGWESKIDYTAYRDKTGQFVEFIDFCRIRNLDRAFQLVDELAPKFFQLNQFPDGKFECLMGEKPIVEVASGSMGVPGRAIVVACLKLKGVI